MKKILAISGSTRKTSTNHRILDYLKTAVSEKDGFSIEIYPGVDTLPHFNEDLDKDPPASVIEFRNALSGCDGVILCSPEYVFSLPGSFKNALDWLVSTTVLFQKPLAMIVAAASGEEAFRSLRKISETLGASIQDESTLLVQGARGKIESDGEPKPELSSELDRLIDSFMMQIFNAS
ncbi:MAG TPA: FMN reductase [Leptospiraceae bacterium]|nr:FMN reductase [Spirochaetaceae bacterium]HBS06515.1 FMN reductase [Leptospiraceae bacterium]|tara:strand:+ start:25233 stop:25766 length:534 start_codon:yes stop_codon:yes gene_type:complete